MEVMKDCRLAKGSAMSRLANYPERFAEKGYLMRSGQELFRTPPASMPRQRAG
jgi:hypothetical protein